ncbi:MAG: hypothetical protein PHD76_13160 [Methylacidiphilales bacterium]|nr:hypothetical protein [Candidatus Methylacidiphilales bacterium]
MKDKNEYDKMRKAVSNAFEKCEDKSGVGAVGRNLRKARGALAALGIVSIAVSLDPDNASAKDFARAINNIQSSLNAGQSADNSDIMDAALAVSKMYGSDAGAYAWGALKDL